MGANADLELHSKHQATPNTSNWYQEAFEIEVERGRWKVEGGKMSED